MPVYQLEKEPYFPHPHLAEDSGLLAIGGDLSTARLIQAYSLGIFPWYSEGEPILWWSPDPRMILYPEKFKVSKSYSKTIQQNNYQVKFDTRFQKVVEACSHMPRGGQQGTWITREMQGAYLELHRKGLAHSVEVYDQNQLVGGLYGVSLGKAFFGESMFHVHRDASKIALYHLVERVKTWDFKFIDAQIETSHLISLGAINVPRKVFLEQLKEAVHYPNKAGKW